MTLAIAGGEPVIGDFSQLKRYKWVDNEIKEEVYKILELQEFSGFLAQENSFHNGGYWNQKLEQEWNQLFGGHESVAFNSWTSAMQSMLMALDLPSTSEIIVPGWTMSATISSIAMAGYSPVIVDIDPINFGISVEAVSEAISTKTRAILGVDIFGIPCDLEKIANEVKNKEIILLVDSAQTPLARLKGKHNIERTEAGGFSLNRHKHIQSGEGGISVTRNKLIARKMRAIRNHAEVSDKNLRWLHQKNLGSNLRMSEISACIASVQTKKIYYHVEHRRRTGLIFSEFLKSFEGIEILKQSDRENDYYILPMRINKDLIGLTNEDIAKALKAEGLEIVIDKYAELSSIPAFNEFSWCSTPVIDKFNQEEFLGLYLCGLYFDDHNIDLVKKCFEKVWDNLKYVKKN